MRRVKLAETSTRRSRYQLDSYLATLSLTQDGQLNLVVRLLEGNLYQQVTEIADLSPIHFNDNVPAHGHIQPIDLLHARASPKTCRVRRPLGDDSIDNGSSTKVQFRMKLQPLDDIPAAQQSNQRSTAHNG